VTGIEHINLHPFRHLAVTELLERGASEQTVVAIAGWSSPRMFATYSHARLEAKINALNLLGPGRFLAPTPHVQQPQTSQQTDPPQVSLDLMNPVTQAEIAFAGRAPGGHCATTGTGAAIRSGYSPAAGEKVRR
jgi:hypothetical protein